MWTERVKETTPSSVYSSITITKTISLKAFSFYFTTPITKLLLTLELKLLSNNNELTSAVLYVPFSVLLVLDSVGYHNYET